MRMNSNIDSYNIWKKKNPNKSWWLHICELIENGNTKLDHRQYKKYLIYKFGSKCMTCNWNKINPVTGKVTIELNHKDGNSNNNKLSNLELLCPNCHSLTPTYKNLNRGNGRRKRRNIYRAGVKVRSGIA